MTAREPLKIRDLFDPDDVLSQWVFALTTTVADLGQAETLFQDALKANELPMRTLYLYRQVLARMYEAERVVIAIEQQPAVAEFIEELPEARAPAAHLCGRFLPVEKSEVRETFGLIRHRTVHHSRVGSEELRETLAVAAQQPARILVDRDDQTVLHEFPETVIAHALAPDLGSEAGIAEFVAQAKQAQEILRQFVALLRATLHPYCERRGLDPKQLYWDVREF